MRLRVDWSLKAEKDLEKRFEYIKEKHFQIIYL
jgi:hypothetical protein